MNKDFLAIFNAIKADGANADYTKRGIDPLYSDLPPRKGFAEQWHPALLALMPNVRLTVLVGAYAVRRYLHLKNSDSLTTVVRDYDAYIGRGFFPLVHPSPRNQLWMSRNPWFEAETLPALKAQVNAALEQR